MRRRLALGTLLGALSQLAAIGLLLVSAWLISRAAEQPPVMYLMVAIVGVRFFGIARAALRYGERLLTHDAAFELATRQRLAVYDDLDRLAPGGLGDTRRGDLVSRVVADVESGQDRLLRVRLPWTITTASVLVVVSLLAFLDWRAALVVLTTAGATAAGVHLLTRWVESSRQAQVAPLRGELAAEASELVLNAPDLVAYGAGEPVRERLRGVDARLAAAQNHLAWTTGLGNALVLLATGVAVVLSSVVATDGSLAPVLVAVLVLAPVALVDPFSDVVAAEGLRAVTDAADRRLRAFHETPAPVPDPDEPEPRPAGHDLRVRDLAVGWGDTPVASGIDLDLPEGGLVAVAGRSGGGKSTLALTLLRLLPARAGTVELGGVDVDRLRGADVRSVVGYLGQDEHVFDTTIRENLRVGDPSAGDARLWQALESAGMADFVATLPDGLDTRTGERGGRLSGGERQRLALARLLLGGHRVLVLDEPTEHLDEQTADALVDDLLALRPGRSLLLVSHDPRVLARADVVVHLDAVASV